MSDLVPELGSDLLLDCSLLANAFIPRPITGIKDSKTTVIVTATLIPDTKWLVHISVRNTAIMMMTMIHHMPPFPRVLSHIAIVSWLNAMSTNGMEIAAEIETDEN
jgi:hypothetical protein